jgi:hypothetical protein
VCLEPTPTTYNNDDGTHKAPSTTHSTSRRPRVSVVSHYHLLMSSQTLLRWLSPLIICVLALGNIFLMCTKYLTSNVNGEATTFQHPIDESANEESPRQAGVRHITRNLVVYNHDSIAFADTFAHCSFNNPNCKIHYHHVQKTGGSRLASRLYPLLSKGASYNSKKWCCQDEMMDRFNANISQYCEHNKFGIYEVTAPQYSNVIQSCIDYNNAPQQNRNLHEPNEIIGLMTIREPIQLTLSQLHHQCNKNFKHKSPEEQKMCKSCNFLKNRDYFLEYVHQTNLVFLDIAQEIPRLLNMLDGQINHQRRNSTTKAIHKMMILDQADIDSFFKAMESRLPAGVVIPEGRGNEEMTGHCYFGVTSHMMKALAPSLEIYRYLTSGLVWQPASNM